MLVPHGHRYKGEPQPGTGTGLCWYVPGKFVVLVVCMCGRRIVAIKLGRKILIHEVPEKMN